MLLGEFRGRLRLAGAIALAVLASACGDDGPGPGPNTQPVVSAVSPKSGTSFGGTTITVTGQNFASGATVQVGTSAATDVTVVSDTTITAKTPAQAAGVKDVRVTVGTRSATLVGAFTFVAPVTGPNSPPVINSLAVQTPRPEQPIAFAAIGDRVTLSATVSDTETLPANLSYEWTALPNIGTFSGSGPSLQWTAPATVSAPVSVTLILTVIERYQIADSQGLPQDREHRVQAVHQLRVHDTLREVGDMAVDFLTRFSNSSITDPDVVLHNFSRTCDGGSGYREERGDILDNRRDWIITAFSAGTVTRSEYEFGADNACSRTTKRTAGDFCVEVPWQWSNRCAPGSPHAFCNPPTGSSTFTETTKGVDFVSAVYEVDRWRLCHSRWEPNFSLTGRPMTIDREDRAKLIIRPPGK